MQIATSIARVNDGSGYRHFEGLSADAAPNALCAYERTAWAAGNAIISHWSVVIGPVAFITPPCTLPLGGNRTEPTALFILQQIEPPQII